MAEEDLDEADIDAALEQMGGEAVTEGVGSKMGVKAALLPRLVEGGAGGGLGQVGQRTLAGKEPPGAAVGLPDLAEHVQDGLGQGQDSFFVALADDAQPHLVGVDGRDGQGDALGNPQALGVDEGEAAAQTRLVQGGDQAAAVVVTTDIGQALLPRLANFFL